ncbi:hypothetical protein L6452_36291 [Arctium lappa]|uniref:Uncharacterized protein n=1 Tax=Arctium lappa TaxID=4217 RepID=A0ACB8Y828_ARCLA|nr:hypothetical protein L6452_36291 [Arctium lappa]
MPAFFRANCTLRIKSGKCVVDIRINRPTPTYSHNSPSRVENWRTAMDPYAAQTYPPSSSQIQPQNQDQYLYNQQYDQSQHYPYYPQIPQHQYPNPNPNPVYQQHPEQEPAPIHPPGVPILNDPTHMAAYQHGYNTTHFQNDPYYPQPQQQQLSYSDPGLVHQGQQQWQQQGLAADYGLTSLYPPK